jgi:hypothetical protein
MPQPATVWNAYANTALFEARVHQLIRPKGYSYQLQMTLEDRVLKRGSAAADVLWD